MRRRGVEAPRVDDETYRPHWRRITQLDRLYAQRAISLVALMAARRYVRDIERAGGPSSVSRMDDRGFGRSTGREQLPRIAALARVRAVRAALGPGMTYVLDLVLIRDMTWVALAKALGCGDKAARSRAVAAIEALGRLPERVDRDARPVRREGA